MKNSLYKEFLDRAKAAKDDEFYLQASWYCYSIIEDRCSSLLRQAGTTDAIWMLGPKLNKLKELSNSNVRLKGAIQAENLMTEINTWKNDRNSLMHAMASGGMSIDAIDQAAAQLAESGLSLAKQCCAAARRFKKQMNR